LGCLDFSGDVYLEHTSKATVITLWRV
jgi:hypothetical protein